MIKKTLMISMTSIIVAGAANASGFYVAPRVSWNTLFADEARSEKNWNADKSAWADKTNGKHEAWDGKDGRISPKFAVGYDYDAKEYGIFGLEIEYGQSKHSFDVANAYVDFDGQTPNDSGDVRHMSYSDSTIFLNAKYGYNVKDIFIPYISAGIGYTTIDSQNAFRSGTYWWDTRATENNFAWNVGAGIEVPVAKNVSLTLAYTYTNLGNVEYSNWLGHEKGTSNGVEAHFDSSVDLYKHELTAGAKIMF